MMLQPRVAEAVVLFSAAAALSGAIAPSRQAAATLALRADDACSADDSERCAVSHLQTLSSRGDAAASSAAGGRSKDPAAVADTLAATPEKAAPTEEPVQTEWTFPMNDDMAESLKADIYTKMFNTGLGKTIKFVDFCGKWLNYFWPKLSFLALEFRRRAKLLPDDISPEQKEKLRDFRTFIAWWMCQHDMDPRNGTKYGAPAASTMRNLAAFPSDSLEVPEFDAWFGQQNATGKAEVNAFTSCMVWTSGMVCDLGYLADSLGGRSGDPDNICWDKLQHPKYLYAPMLTRSVTPPGMEWYDNHTEYSACQEHHLTSEVLHDYCPWHAKMPKGILGIEWGKEPDHTSEQYKDIMQCELKVGLPPEEFPMCRDPAQCDIVDMGYV